MQTAYTILILLTLVGFSKLAGRLIPVPLPLPLVQVSIGTLLAWPDLGLHVTLNPELFLLLFLPPLLFSDGWRMPKRELWRYRVPILLLAIGLVLFTVVMAGLFIHMLLPSISLPVAFALAAVMSPTDAVAVSAIAQDKLPTPILRVLQGEALMNDASGLVTFKFAIAAALTGVFSLPTAGITFVIVACGGLITGVILSWTVGRFRSWMIDRGWDDPATHVVFMLLVPFAAYLIAERLQVSGILSAVAAGMMQSWVDLLPRQTTTRLLNRSVWTLLEFVFNGIIFLLLGLQLPEIVGAVTSAPELNGSVVQEYCIDIVLIFVVFLALRFIWAQFTCIITARLSHGKPKNEPTNSLSTVQASLLITFGGVRGAVTLAAVLSVPVFISQNVQFPQRDLIIFIAAGVILLSLIAATVALPLLLKGVIRLPEQKIKDEISQAWKRTAEAAIRSLEAEVMSSKLPDAAEMLLVTQAKSLIMSEYRHRLEIFNDTKEAQSLAFERDVVERKMRVNALKAQRLELFRMHKHNEIPDDVLATVLAELDLSEANLGRS
jgi:CPA1 family monovalent cation:H+ antiporter